MVKITVYITTYNYGKYIERAVESVLKQTTDDWELIIIDDGSTDNTQEVITKYRSHPKIHIVEQVNKGLTVSNNIALRLAKGDYIMRLDADDYLDENILLVLSNVLDSKPEVGLVYPDYYLMGEDGDVLEIVRRKKLEEEVELLDLPAHGACTMFRKSFLQEIGGYTEDFSCQDGYDIWLRMIQRYKPYNVNVPLFYYRQHSVSLTKNQEKILDTRRKIKRQFVEKNNNGESPKVVGIIPVVGSPVCSEMEPFVEVNDKPLLWYTLNEIEQATSLDKVILSSDDDRVLDYAKQFSKIIAVKRPAQYTKTTTKMLEIVQHILKQLKDEDNYQVDWVCLLYMNTPLRRARHIEKAIDTMKIFDVDSVISIEEEFAPCYNHLKFGLTPINEAQGNIRLERKSIFKENGAVYLSKASVIENGQLIGEKVGHITMLPEESLKINSAYDLWLAEKILQEWRTQRNMNRQVIRKDFLNEIKEGVTQAKKEIRDQYGLTPGNNVDLICEKLYQLGDKEGSYVECGVFQGNTFFSVASFLKKHAPRKMYGLDTFEGFPNPQIDEQDHPKVFSRLFKQGEISETHYQKALERTKDLTDTSHLTQEYFCDVSKVFEIAKHFENVELVKGSFQETLTKLTQPIAVLFLDCDLYQSYMDCLEKLYPLVIPGGSVIFDEYYSFKYPGARIAVNEFFKDKQGQLEQYTTEEGFERWCFVKGSEIEK